MLRWLATFVLDASSIIREALASERSLRHDACEGEHGEPAVLELLERGLLLLLQEYKKSWEREILT